MIKRDELLRQAREARAQAARAHRLAMGTNLTDAAQLIAYGQELDDRARALEGQAFESDVSLPPVTQPQQQQAQQQQSSAAPTATPHQRSSRAIQIRPTRFRQRPPACCRLTRPAPVLGARHNDFYCCLPEGLAGEYSPLVSQCCVSLSALPFPNISQRHPTKLNSSSYGRCCFAKGTEGLPRPRLRQGAARHIELVCEVTGRNVELVRGL